MRNQPWEKQNRDRIEQRTTHWMGQFEKLSKKIETEFFERQKPCPHCGVLEFDTQLFLAGRCYDCVQNLRLAHLQDKVVLIENKNAA